MTAQELIEEVLRTYNRAPGVPETAPYKLARCLKLAIEQRNKLIAGIRWAGFDQVHGNIRKRNECDAILDRIAGAE